MSGCYVYALLDAPQSRLRLPGRTIETIAAGDMFAAVERADAPPAASEKALEEQHAIIARLAGRARAILPMRFGAFVDESELRQFVNAHRIALTGALALVRGREQMTVRLFGEPVPRLRVMAPAPAASGTEFLRRRREAVRSSELPKAATLVQHAVRPLVAAERVETGEGAVRATLWHLIERGTSEAYRTAVGRIAEAASPLHVAVTGPWAPFAFAPELRA